MITQDIANSQTISISEQPKNLHLNPAAPVFRQATPDKGLSHISLEFDTQPQTTAAVLEGHVTNGDIHLVANDRNYVSMPGVLAAVESTHQVISSAVPGSGDQGQLIAATQIGHQAAAMVTVPSQHQQGAYQIVHESENEFRQPQPDVAAVTNQLSNMQGISNGESELTANDNLNSPTESAANVEDGDTVPESSVADIDEEDDQWDGIEREYPELDLLNIRRQIEYYFSAENLPNDKYLNQNMDKDKYVSLSIILGFNRMRQICVDGKDGKGQMIQAIKTSSVLELNEKKTKVRVSQTRKTLTLRGLPPRATEDDVKSVLKDNDCPVAMHIENIMVQNNVSNWYVSFENEAHCLDAFFKLHGSKAQLHGYTIGCCIKSSGTHAASGYFPPQEENQQRKITHTQPTVASATSQPSVTPQPQSPAALIQPHQYGTMSMHHPSFMPTGHQNLYYPQGAHPQSMYVNPYVPQMITQGWAGATGLDPGLVSIEAICLAYRQRRAASQQIMQNNGLQPQHIRTPIARPHVIQSGTTQHRFVKPQRSSNRHTALERSGPERPNDRTSQVTVSGTSTRSSPRTIDGSNGNMVPPGGYVPRRHHDEVATVMPQPQPSASQHQYITPLVSQPQQQPQQAQHTSSSISSTTAIVNPTVMDPIAVVTGQHFQQQHQQPLMVQTGLGSNSVGSVPHTQTSNPPPIGLHQSHHPQTNHHQPPPPMPHHHQQQHHNHHHHPPPHHHHQQQQPSQTVPPHHGHPHSHHQPPPPHHQHVSVNQHHTQQPPPQPHGHHPHQHGGHSSAHHPHHQHMMPPHHHHNPQIPPPPPGPHHQQHHHPHHQQNPPQSGRNDRRPRRKREENPRNNRQNERNQSNRANFSSQVPPVADNFTMEANSFPPLPGATNNIASAESMFENKMADVVRGRPRLSGGPNSSSSVASSVRANSTTPSPVATPTPNPVSVVSIGQSSTASVNKGVNSTSHQQPMSVPNVMVSRTIETCNSALEDVTSSSQEDDADLVSQLVHDGQGIIESVPLPQRTPKIQPPVVNVVIPTQRQMEMPGRPSLGHTAPPARSQPQQAAFQMASVVCSVPPTEATGFKLSYAQIAAQKNREAAGNNGLNVIEASPVSVVPPTHTHTSSAGSPSPSPSSGGSSVYKSSQSGNGVREQVANQPQVARITSRPVKDSFPRVEGQPNSNSRPISGRRNSKEARVVPGKFDRRKGDGRAK